MSITKTTPKTPKAPAASPSRPVTTAKKAAASFPEKTPDGRFILVNGRRWRATDPLIPTLVLSELKHYLGMGRSGVRGRKANEDTAALARRRTGLAKLGLGERGKPEWWNDTEDGRRKRWEEALRELKALDNTSS